MPLNLLRLIGGKLQKRGLAAKQATTRSETGAPSKAAQNQPKPDRTKPGRPEADRPEAKKRKESRARPPKAQKPPLPSISEKHADWDPASFKVAPKEGKKRFQDFDLPNEMLRAIHELGFEYCTPIQAETLALTMDGRNVAGRAQTGTGKTAAFLITILKRMLNDPESRPKVPGQPAALVIGPTRELVIQIAKDAEDLGKFCNLRCVAVYGGMDYAKQQEAVAKEPIDIMVATPGRLLDFRRSRVVNLGSVHTLVIDEADRMLDMGFIPDVRRIIRELPGREKRQTLLFSATLDDDVMRLASQWMPDPIQINVEPENATVKTIRQVVYPIAARDKTKVLYNLIRQESDQRILVFCNRRIGCERLTESLSSYGVKCETLSGDVAQKKRLRVLDDFRDKKNRVVIATDVAGRGIHVDDIGFVVNYDFPYDAEDYIHRIGRTGRAGHTGTAISFACEDESFIIPEIEELLGEELACEQPPDELFADLPPPRRRERKPRGEGKTRTGGDDWKTQRRGGGRSRKRP